MTAFDFFLDWQLNCQFAGLIWAREKGLYEQAGLDVRLVSPEENPGVSPIDLVLDGHCAVGSVEENLILRAAAEGKPLRAVAAMLRETPLVLMTARDGPIESLADLPGRQVAMHRDGRHLLAALLEMSGIDPVEVSVTVEGWSLKDLTAGRFDAVQGYAITEARTLANAGFEARLIPMRHRDLHPHSQVVFANSDSVLAQENELRALLKATFEGWGQALEDPEEAAVLVAVHSEEHNDPAENRRILELLRNYVCGSDGIQLGALDPERWRRNLASALHCGLVEGELDLDQLIAPHLLTDTP